MRFAGVGTTCVAAERLNRRWVGVDVCEKAFDLVQERMKKEVAVGLVACQTSPPVRTDLGAGVRAEICLYPIKHAV